MRKTLTRWIAGLAVFMVAAFIVLSAETFELYASQMQTSILDGIRNDVTVINQPQNARVVSYPVQAFGISAFYDEQEVFTVRIPANDNSVHGLSVGNIFVLEPTHDIPDGLAGRITHIFNEGFYVVITATVPSIDEIFTDFDFSGDFDLLDFEAVPIEWQEDFGIFPMQHGFSTIQATSSGFRPSLRTTSRYIEASVRNGNWRGVTVDGSARWYYPRLNVRISIRNNRADLYITTGASLNFTASAQGNIDTVIPLMEFRVRPILGIRVDIPVGIRLTASGEARVEVISRLDLGAGIRNGTPSAWAEFRSEINFNLEATATLSLNLQARARLLGVPAYGIQLDVGRGVRFNSATQGRCPIGSCVVVERFRVLRVSSLDWGALRFLRFNHNFAQNSSTFHHFYGGSWHGTCPHIGAGGGSGDSGTASGMFYIRFYDRGNLFHVTRHHNGGLVGDFRAEFLPDNFNPGHRFMGWYGSGINAGYNMRVFDERGIPLFNSLASTRDVVSLTARWEHIAVPPPEVLPTPIISVNQNTGILTWACGSVHTVNVYINGQNINTVHSTKNVDLGRFIPEGTWLISVRFLHHSHRELDSELSNVLWFTQYPPQLQTPFISINQNTSVMTWTGEGDGWHLVRVYANGNAIWTSLYPVSHIELLSIGLPYGNQQIQIRHLHATDYRLHSAQSNIAHFNSGGRTLATPDISVNINTGILTWSSGASRPVAVYSGGVRVWSSVVNVNYVNLNNIGLNPGIHSVSIRHLHYAEISLSSALSNAINFVSNSSTEIRLLLQMDSNLIIDLTGNTSAVVMDVLPVIENGRTMVPVRFIAYSLGAEVGFFDATPERPLTVYLIFEGRMLTIPVGSINTYLMLQGLDVPAHIVNGRTMVPLRFISEYFGATVEWNENTRTIEITR